MNIDVFLAAVETPIVLGSVLAAIGTLLGIAVSISKLRSSFQKEVNDKIESEITKARAIAEGDLKAVDLKLDGLSRDILKLEEKIESDISNVKEVYNSEIKSLAGKVESLREEVRHQHGQLVSLLTKLVSEK